LQLAAAFYRDHPQIRGAPGQVEVLSNDTPRPWRQKTLSCSSASPWKRWSQRARRRRNEFGPGAPWQGDRLPTPADRAPVRAIQS
jgi:hypothetical protein